MKATGGWADAVTGRTVAGGISGEVEAQYFVTMSDTDECVCYI